MMGFSFEVGVSHQVSNSCYILLLFVLHWDTGTSFPSTVKQEFRDASQWVYDAAAWGSARCPKIHSVTLYAV